MPGIFLYRARPLRDRILAGVRRDELRLATAESALLYRFFQRARARLKPLLLDEAFYGLDAQRRDELLAFAT